MRSPTNRRPRRSTGQESRGDRRRRLLTAVKNLKLRNCLSSEQARLLERPTPDERQRSSYDVLLDVVEAIVTYEHQRAEALANLKEFPSIKGRFRFEELQWVRLCPERGMSQQNLKARTDVYRRMNDAAMEEARLHLERYRKERPVERRPRPGPRLSLHEYLAAAAAA